MRKLNHYYNWELGSQMEESEDGEYYPVDEVDEFRDAVVWLLEVLDTSPMEAEDYHAFCASYEDVKRLENQSNEHELIKKCARKAVEESLCVK